MEDGGRLAAMTSELVDRMAILVAVRRFHGMGDVDSRSLRFDSYVRMHHFARRTTYVPFGVFWGMCGDGSIMLFMVLWLPIFATLCMRTMLMLWHAFMFLGLRLFLLFFSLFGGLHCFFW
jgi:hypothetical protein